MYVFMNILCLYFLFIHLGYYCYNSIIIINIIFVILLLLLLLLLLILIVVVVFYCFFYCAIGWVAGCLCAWKEGRESELEWDGGGGGGGVD